MTIKLSLRQIKKMEKELALPFLEPFENPIPLKNAICSHKNLKLIDYWDTTREYKCLECKRKFICQCEKKIFDLEERYEKFCNINQAYNDGDKSSVKEYLPQIGLCCRNLDKYPPLRTGYLLGNSSSFHAQHWYKIYKKYELESNKWYWLKRKEYKIFHESANELNKIKNEKQSKASDILYELYRKKPTLKEPRTLIRKKIDKANSSYRRAELDYNAKIKRLNSIQPQSSRNFLKEAENYFRVKYAVPKIGEGWVSEMQLLNAVKNLVQGYEVIHQGSPEWLKPQRFDIWIPKIKLAFEYQGKQHYEPIKHFGGLEGFRKTKQRDKRKADLCKKHKVDLIYIKYDMDMGEKMLKSILNEIMIKR